MNIHLDYCNFYIIGGLQSCEYDIHIQQFYTGIFLIDLNKNFNRHGIAGLFNKHLRHSFINSLINSMILCENIFNKP